MKREIMQPNNGPVSSVNPNVRFPNPVIAVPVPQQQHVSIATVQTNQTHASGTTYEGPAVRSVNETSKDEEDPPSPKGKQPTAVKMNFLEMEKERRLAAKLQREMCMLRGVIVVAFATLVVFTVSFALFQDEL